MVDIAPLCPLHYEPSLLPRVVAPPYDVVDPALRARLAARDPHNVVHIDLPEGDGAARVARPSSRRSSLGPFNVSSWGRTTLSLKGVARTAAKKPRRRTPA